MRRGAAFRYPRVVSTFPVRTFGDPVLRQRANEVEELDGDLARLVDTMFDTMYDALGLGLAAPAGRRAEAPLHLRRR